MKSAGAGSKNVAPPDVAEFDLIVADCPWRYSFSRSKSRKIENHYPTMSVQEIKDLGLVLKFPKNAILFLWATAPKLPQALEVMKAWGFEYVTNAVWDKKKIGMGYWFRGRHELILVGRRGKFSPPPPALRIGSVIQGKRGRHSKKPEAFQDWVERAFPGKRKIELFARRSRPGWKVWGNAVIDVDSTATPSDDEG